MNYTVELSIKARLELSQSWTWYEEQQRGLGDRFEETFFNKAYLIQTNPLHYPVKGNYRQAPTDIFPFLIVFKVDRRKGLILVVSVFHTSRHPRRKYTKGK